MNDRCGRAPASRALTTAALALWLFTSESVLAQTPSQSEPLPPAATLPTEPDDRVSLTRAANGHPTVRAFRVGGPMDIDGRLDEPFYASTRPIDHLVQAVPMAGGVPSERTETWIGFDDTNLYVAARIWDSQGEAGWIANEMRRDSFQLRSNDSFGIYLDTYLDRRNALGFFVNPIGGFADVQLTNEGNPNFDWNPVWDLATGRFDGGWTIEMAIPFKSLRYRPGVEQVWGIQIRRSVFRDNEWSYLTPVPIQVAGAGPNAVFRVSMYGDLVGLEVPPVGRNIDVKPYVTSRLSTDRLVSPVVDNDFQADAGLDVKYALTPNLTLDLTANTDFAQVEVDEQQVNLTRFGLSFPEKRDFFLEGRGVFNFGSGGFGGTGGGGGGGGPTLFYSRRIGLQGGDPVQVLGGARLTGKVGAFDIGALSMQTDSDESIGAESTNFTVLRVQRNVFSRSNVGALFQNRSRSLVAPGSASQAWGVDASLGLTTDLSLVAYYARSQAQGLEGNDESYRASIAYDADRYGLSVGGLVVGNDFNPEIGLVRRRDFRQGSVSTRFSPRPASIDWIRQFSFQANLAYLENDRTRTIESRDRGVQLQVDLENGDGLTASLGDSHERLANDERIAGTLIPAGSYGFREHAVIYRFGSQRPWQANLGLRWGGYYTGDRRSVEIGNGRLEISPRLSVEPSVEFNWLDLPQQTEPGQLDQHVARTRITYTMTPRAYVSGLVQYNSGSDSFSANLRLRWEWAPGSELFLVYTEERDTGTLDDRWSELSNRGLALKVTRLLRP